MRNTKTEIELIGTALFGGSWLSQVAKNLTDLKGKTISRQSVQNWRTNNRVPIWAKEQLILVAKRRLHEITQLNQLFDNYDSAVNQAIERFLENHGLKLKPGSVIYCKLTFDTNEYGFDSYEAEITLEKPLLMMDWHRYELEEKYFQRSLIHQTSPWKPPLFRGWRKRRIF